MKSARQRSQSNSDFSNTDPFLGPLQDNGGPTLTHALLASSRAIDSGDDSVVGSPFRLTKDQRGEPRLQGVHVDIGAYEAIGLPASLVTVGWTMTGWVCYAPGDPAAIATTLGGTVRIYDTTRRCQLTRGRYTTQRCRPSSTPLSSSRIGMATGSSTSRRRTLPTASQTTANPSICYECSGLTVSRCADRISDNLR